MIRGQRFELNLDDDENDQSNATEGQARPPMPATFVADVSERKSTAPRPPQAPTMKHKSGFPEHQKRPVQSRFKQQQQTKAPTDLTSKKTLSTDSPPSSKSALPSAEATKTSSDQPRNKSVSFAATEDDQPGLSSLDRERAQIDRDNNQYLASMTPTQREAERQELLDSISPGFLQKLLMRANIDSGSAEVDLETDVPVAREAEERGSAVKPEVQEKILVARGEEQSASSLTPSKKNPPTTESAKPPKPVLPDQPPTHSNPPQPPTQAPTTEPKPPKPDHDDSSALPPIHFPLPTQPPPLDPSSPSFLTDLHEKYFPHLPSNPSALSWTQSISSPNGNTYDPSSTHLSAGSIRFDFSGALIPPRLAAELPVTLGLHHHSDAPDAAGYTLAELAHLARSKFAAQRCVAFQTLGRVMWRLGRGEFGNASAASASAAGNGVSGEEGSVIAEEEEEEHLETSDSPAVHGGDNDALRNARLNDPSFAALALGLWREIDRLNVISILVAESTGGEGSVDGGRHLSAKAYATEALWLWRRSGGRRWKAA
jgi:hypothetical protein